VISSVITALCGAELKFFTGECVTPPIIPRNVPQVLEVASTVKADGLTAPAAALYPYYVAKKVVKFFIVVTDEIENEKYKDYFFPELFVKYYNEVYPSKIVFVSFLENPSEKGRMVTALESLGIVPLQFKLDGKRPDLTKLDSLLGLLASENSLFPKHAEDIAKICKEKGLAEVNSYFSTPKTSTTSTTSSKDEIEPVKIFEKKELNANEKDIVILRGEIASFIDDLQRKNALLKKELVEVPQEFTCCITEEIMEDPVCTCDGHSYERNSIMKWFEKSKTSPKTGLPLENTILIPNHSLKSQIQSFREKANKMKH